MRDPNARAVLNMTLVREMRALVREMRARRAGTCVRPVEPSRCSVVPRSMTTSSLIQILCRMDPKTPVYLSLDGYPPINIQALHACYDERVEGQRVVVLSTKTPEGKSCAGRFPV